MKRCNKMADVGRRQFLRGGGVAAVAVAAATVAPNQAQAHAKGGAVVEYPGVRLGNIKDLRINDPMDVSYPDDDAPGVLLKLGSRVEGGVGPDGDIVGFTTVCPHKGYGLNYNETDKTFNCPAHLSRFDVEAGGQQIWGHATQNLPQYVLRIDASGDIFAEGIDELLHGRLSNIL